MKEPNTKAQACVIWMHGLGADATDMMGLSEQLLISDLNLRHVYIDAPSIPVTLNNGIVMPAWYNILGLELTDREDRDGIAESAALIRELIEEQLKVGFASHQIYLAGFSQGGAMALHTALHFSGRLGGVIALSAYLPLADETNPQLDTSTPIFMTSGQYDPLVLPMWSQQSRTWLVTHGYEQVDLHSYPMEHAVCYEELRDLSFWLIKQVQEG